MRFLRDRPGTGLEVPPMLSLNDILNLRDVTSSARDWGFCFSLHIDKGILSKFAGASTDDEEGSLLIGSIVMAADQVLAGILGFAYVTYGDWFACDFYLQTWKRPGCSPAKLKLKVVFGPCLSESPAAFVRM